MRTKNYFLATQKEIPADAQIISHQLMLRAGMIRKVAAGIYNWLPLGLNVLKKVEAIVRDEMNKAGALEIFMPCIQPAELWQETGRWETFTPPLLKLKDRHGRDFCFGPTHEDVITDLMRHELNSYKQLPLTLYQIQTKFRDELRPRSGIMRAREFIMKDAYSFHMDADSLAKTYDIMYQAYTHIFSRLGLEFRAVLADTGAIGGMYSHEFQILAESGEDLIAVSDQSDYAANIELAKALAPKGPREKATAAMEEVVTPNTPSIAALCEFFKVRPEKIAKTLIIKSNDEGLIALVLRGDHELNEVKAEKIPNVKVPLTFASMAEIEAVIGCKPGYVGPVGLNIPFIVDESAAMLANFICGANKFERHLQYVNWQRDVELGQIADIRKVVAGDPSPDGKGTLKLIRGIEAGHIFQLGDKYSKAMHATVLDQNGQATSVHMGCYGLGVSRLIAACIEQNHDDNGIIWPEAMAPFHVVIIPINMYKSPKTKQASEDLYAKLLEKNIEVLLDDRDERAGVLFADMDLIGIPHRIVVSERNLKQGKVEYKARRDNQALLLSVDEVLERIYPGIPL